MEEILAGRAAHGGTCYFSALQHQAGGTELSTQMMQDRANLLSERGQRYLQMWDQGQNGMDGWDCA